MDSGWAALGGSLIGGLVSLGATFLAHWLTGADARKLARVRQDTLKKRLDASNRNWVPIEDLMNCIGADRDTTVQHLLMIRARRSLVGNDVWGFKGLPEPSSRTPRTA